MNDHLATHEIEHIRNPTVDVNPDLPERPTVEAHPLDPFHERFELREVETGAKIEGRVLLLGSGGEPKASTARDGAGEGEQ